jgi:hypothetical protein
MEAVAQHARGPVVAAVRHIDPLGVTVTVMPVESTDAIYLNAAVDGPSVLRHSFSRITEGRLVSCLRNS